MFTNMEPRYRTLRTIYEIVKNDPEPLNYLCRPREIILRQYEDLNIIQQHLELLKVENLIITKRLDTRYFHYCKWHRKTKGERNYSIAKLNFCRVPFYMH
jgi:hypothetical protein